MITKHTPVVKNIRGFRNGTKESQKLFWRRFGISQPNGSRYENGQAIPLPTALLLDLFMRGIINEHQLGDSKEHLNIMSQVLRDE